MAVLRLLLCGCCVVVDAGFVYEDTVYVLPGAECQIAVADSRYYLPCPYSLLPYIWQRLVLRSVCVRALLLNLQEA
jgi:hypothetical protein